MSYIFLDESGDLGFNFNKKRTTKYFVITLLFVDNKRQIEKVVKSIHRGIREKHTMKSGILHAYKEESITRLRFCKRILTKDCKVMTIYLNKRKVYTRLQNEKIILYNYVTNILLDRIMTKKLINKGQKINLIASRRETNKFLNLNFKKYLEQQILNKHNIIVQVDIKTPFQEKALQAVDMISWPIFRKYEYGDDTYYKIIKDIIVEENSLFS